MVYYNATKIGTGTENDEYRPDIPNGISWEWCRDCGNVFLIGSVVLIEGLTPMTDTEFESYCLENGIVNAP